jgi:transcriptional antiterminator Rof (Rho-off)
LAKNNCKSCGKEFKFFGSQAAGLFCSRECSHDYRTKLIMESGKAKKATAVTYLKRFVEYKCSCCGISEWQGKAISLQIDHIDGNSKNNVKENIRWLCPNCHTQTHNWGFRNASEDAKERSRQGAIKGNKTTFLNNRSCLTVKELEDL